VICPRCGREVTSELDIGEFRLEVRRKVRGSYDRPLTVSLGHACMRCAREEVEKRRPARAVPGQTLRLEGL
jgi:hypothetical protein